MSDNVSAGAWKDGRQLRELQNLDRNINASVTSLNTNTTMLKDGYVLVRDKKTAGTHGGTFTSGAWQTRTLNEIKHDPSDLCTLGSNQITLTAGTYHCNIMAPACGVSRHIAVLYDVTAGENILTGTSGLATSTGDYSNNYSVIKGRFTIKTGHKLEVRHRCNTTNANQGFGYGTPGWGVDETYTVAEFWQVG